MTETFSKTALVTGASAGLGKLFAEKLASQSYNLIITARRKDRLEEIAQNIINNFGVKVETIVADLAVPDDIKKIENAIKATNNLLLLVNNAGFGIPGYFHEIDINKNLDMISVHIDATKRFCHAALRQMIEQKRGYIINVSSVASFIPTPRGATYCATKSYLTMFSEVLNFEVRKFGITVQALCPGFTQTEFHEAAGYTKEEVSQIPQWMWLNAERVVSESLAALEKGTAIVIPGKRYRFILFLFRLPIFHSLIKRLIRKRRK